MEKISSAGKMKKSIDISSVHCKVLFVTKQFNKNTFSYSEQWRYKGSEKLRQPLNRKVANLSESSNNKRIVVIERQSAFTGCFICGGESKSGSSGDLDDCL